MSIKRDTEGHYIILNGRIHQEVINIVNIYAPNIGAPRYIRKILEDFKKDTDNSILTVGLNTPFSTMDRYSKQRINIVALNNMLYQIGLTNNIEPFTPKKQNICSFQMHMEHF